MKAFLEKVADYIFDNHRDHLNELSVVVPNRRAALFLGKYLSNKTDVPIWSPQFYSIEDFVFKYSGYQLIPLVDLLFELYAVHREIEGAKAQSFDRFSAWGQLLLKDFNELDLYLKDADYIFHYLSEAKAMTIWKLNPEEMTMMERDYLRFYASLGNYYQLLVQRLEAKNLAYQGMAYRKFVVDIENNSLDNKPLIFAGFNALTPAEEVIFDFYKKQNQAKVIWDIDAYYYEDHKQEAGYFLRKQLDKKSDNDLIWLTDAFKEETKIINIYGVSGDVSIAKMAGIILEEMADNSNEKGVKLKEDTALVLANEALIVPMLYSLPDNVDTFNITMSYPSKLSRVYELLTNIFGLYLQQMLPDGKVSKKPAYYYKSLEIVLLHPLVKAHLHRLSASNVAQKISKIIRENNISYISQEKFPTQFDLMESDPAFEFLRLFSKRITKPIELIELIQEILQQLFDNLGSSEEDKLDREFLFHYLNLMRRMGDLLNEHPFIKQFTTLKNLFISLAAEQGIPFTGEPLAGVQIMGMLETRTLDFKNLILLSANEGMLPKAHVYQSFILPDIKRELGLPLPVDNDAVSAYHFYRLIKAANNIHIIYNTQNDSMGQGELSRYVQQIEWELKDYNAKTIINHNLFHIPLQTEDFDFDIRFPKDDYSIDRLKYIANGKGFSPSSLNNYLECSLRFYFQRILGMYSEEEVEETLASNTLGTVIHGVLEEFYLRKKGLVINDSFLDEIKKEYVDELEKRFRIEFKKGDIEHGQNLLWRKVAERFVEHFIESEKQFVKEGIPCTIIDLELELNRSIKLEIDGEVLDVHFRGNADRVDKVGNVVRVIDYKTGKVEAKDVRLFKYKNSIWDEMFLGKKPKSFQLFMYAWMYAPNLESTNQLQAGIIGLKYHSKYYPLAINHKDDLLVSEDYLNDFEKDLKSMMGKLFDRDEDFKQCDDDQFCKYCDYKFICGR